MKYKVLVMDDELGVREVLAAMLQTLDCHVDCVETGIEALEKYACSVNSDTPYDLVVLDLTIPEGMGGEETVRELLQKHPDAHVYVFSGYITEDNKDEYEEWGFKGLINKPFSIAELSDVLQGLA
jgi:two-component system, cell cycle sensor histidine kinase and response regulator CckA